MAQIENFGALIPHPNVYVAMAGISEPLVWGAGGYYLHNVEPAFRPVEEKPLIITPNHRSNLDSFALGLGLFWLDEHTKDSPEGPVSPRVLNYLGKESLQKYPVVRNVVNACGVITVERGRGVGLSSEQISDIGRIIANNGTIGLYPEGHRYKGEEDMDDYDINKMKTTFAFLALVHGLAVMPTGIAGPLGRRLPREIYFKPPIIVPKSEHEPRSKQFEADKRELVIATHDQIRDAYLHARNFVHLRAESRQGNARR